MKWRKAAAGVLAFAVAFSTAASTVPAATVPKAQSSGSTARANDTEIAVPEFTVPEISEGDHPLHIETGIAEDQKILKEVVDRAADPAEFEFVDSSNEDEDSAKFLDGRWGFNQKIVSTDARFNVTGNQAMVISFDLYLNLLNVQNGNECPTLMAKGDEQYSVDISNGAGVRTHSKVSTGGWENRVSNNCLPAAKKWYHVDIVYGGNGVEQHFIDGRATGALKNASVIQEQANAPFTIGFRYTGDTVTGGVKESTVFAAEDGYLADVKFYNGGLQPEIQNGIDLRGWDALDDKGYAQLSSLLESVEPLSDFSVRPYTSSIKWTAKDAPDQALAMSDLLHCGTAYQATKTLTAGDGYVFPTSVSKDDIVANSLLTYHKIKGLTGTADSEQTGHATDLPAYAAVDDNESTHWHSNYSGVNQVQGTNDGNGIYTLTGNNTYTITLPQETSIKRFEYVGRSTNGSGNGDIYKGHLEYSTDGETYTEIAGSTFGFESGNRVVEFANAVTAKYIRIIGEKARGAFLTAKEFYLYTTEPATSEKMSLVGCGSADSEENSGNDKPAWAAVDGDRSTYWHSCWSGGGNGVFVEGTKTDSGNIWNLTGNNTYTITLPTATRLDSFEYAPKGTGQGTSGDDNGDIIEASLQYSTSADGDDFREIDNSTFGFDSSTFRVVFDTPIVARRIRVVGKRAISNDGADGHPFMAAREFSLYKSVNARPVSATVSNASVSADRKQLTVTFDYPAIDTCNSFLSHTAFRNPVNLEEGNTYQIDPLRVFAADGQRIENHPALHVEHHYASSDPETVSVSANGVVTARAAGEATITVTTEAAGMTLSSDITIKVYAEDTMLLHPEFIYERPEAGKYPEIADARMNVGRDDPYMGAVTEVATEGGSKLQMSDGAVPVIERHDGTVGFNGIYTATAVDHQFNATGDDPLVISFKLYLKRLPRDQREHTILSKGNQYNFSYINPAGTQDNKLRFMIGDSDWTKWERDVTNTDLQKWHDILIVADGKNTDDSIQLYIDGVPVEKTGTGKQIPSTDPSTTDLRPFTLFDKPGESSSMTCGADIALISRLKVWDVKNDASKLVDSINIQTLKGDNASANPASAIKGMLDTETPSTYLSARPYRAQTTWYEGTGENKTKLDGKTAFTTAGLTNKGYTAVTVLTANKKAVGNDEYFIFDRAEEEHINEQLLHIFTSDDTENDNKDPMILRNATVSDDQKTMTVEVSFLPTGIPAPRITFTAPREGLTAREYPITGDASSTRRYDFAENGTTWYSVNSEGAKTALAEGTAFTAITDSNKYQVETVLAARDNYRFDAGAEYIEEVKKAVELQRSGNVEATLTVEVLEDGAKLKLTVLYAKPIYTVTFDLNSDSGDPFRQAVSAGRKAVEPETPVRAGYRFDGWCTDTHSHTPFSFDTAITESITVYAHWTRVHTVTYVMNRSDVTPLEPTLYEAGDVSGKDPTAKEPEIAKLRPAGDDAKVKFDGWYTEPSLSNDNKYAFGSPLTGDITLYAKWMADVTYNFNYKSVTPTDPDVSEKEPDPVKITTVINRPLAGPGAEKEKREGFRFDGWYTDAACSDGKRVDLSKGVAFHTTLYAKWVAQVTVSFEPGEAASVTMIEPQVIDKGSRARKPKDLSPKDPTDIFVSWFEKTNDTYNEDPYRFDTPVEKDLTLYAQWAKADALFTVTFMIDGESAATQYVLKNGTAGAKTTEPEIPAQPGKTLDGWYTDADCTQKFDFTATKITANTTLYAKWKAQTARISFVTNGGNSVASMQVAVGTKFSEVTLPTPVRAGYTFDGWYTDQGLTAKVDGNAVVSGNITLYAKWEAQRLESVKVTSEKNLTLSVGDTATVAYDISPKDARGVNISFASSADTVATVTNAGRVTAAGAGSAVITVTAKQNDITKTDTVNVRVVPRPTNIKNTATATTNNTENATHVATNINDGQSNTKWASDIWGGNEGGLNSDGHADGAKRYLDWIMGNKKDTSAEDHHSVWVKYEWPSAVSFQKIVLNWERKNAGAYTLAVSDDDENWKTIYAKDLAKANIKQSDPTAETIVLNKPVTAKYLRIEITKIYAKSGDWETEGGNGWSGCGIYEWDVYDIAEEGYPAFTEPAEVGTQKTTRSGVAFEYTPAAGDATISVTTDMTGMDGAAFADGKFSWTPQLKDVGSYYVTFKAEKDGQATFQTILLKVEEGAPNPDVKYTVTFNVDGGSAIAPQEVTEGGKATKPADPTKDGYKFDNWYKDAAKTQVFDFDSRIVEDTTIYAKWTRDQAAVEKEEQVRARTTALTNAERINMETGASVYTKETWDPFVAAYNALKNLTDEQIDAMSAADLKVLVDALVNAQNALTEIDNPDPSVTKEEAIKAANDALAAAGKINNATEQAKYTADSWKAFVDAYNALNSLTQEQKDAMSATDLKALADALANAQKALKPITVTKPVEVSSLKMSAKKYQLAKNKKFNLAKELTVLPANAANKKVTWSSSNTRVATVNPATGQVKTNKKKTGTTKITATAANGTKVTVTVQVMKGTVTKVKAKGKTKLNAKAGKSVTLKATVSSKGGKANKKLKWSSSNTSIATVGKGTGASMKVKIAKKAKKNKTVKITAISTDGTNKKVTFTIKVK